MAMLAPLTWLMLGMSVPLTGTVEDDRGQPVARASVWLGDTIATNKGPEVLASAETDDAGRFRLMRADDLVGRASMWSPTLWAYAPGSGLAFQEFKGELPGPDEPVRLKLGPPASAALRVVRPDGTPAAGVRIRLVSLALKAPRPPDKLLDRLEATTDADGRAKIDGVTRDDITIIDVFVPDQIVQSLTIDRSTATVVLRPLGRLKVRIVADDPKAVAGWKITARSRPASADRRGPSITHWIRETTGEDGRVEFPAIAEGQIAWEIKPPENSSYIVEKSPNVLIRPGETQEVDVKIRRGTRVEGVVREEPGGAPLAGIKVDLNPLTPGSRRVEWLVTDSKGRFSGVVPPGKVRFSFSMFDMPNDHFLPPNSQHWLDFDINPGEDRHEITPPALHKGERIEGRVVDEDGKAVAGAIVRWSWFSPEFGKNPSQSSAASDARGTFVMGRIGPRSEVKASATSIAIGESESITIPDASKAKPVTLTLRKRPTLALSGRVLDAAGNPLADARIDVMLREPNQRFGQGSRFSFPGGQPIRTGPDGQFRTPALVPAGNHYRVEASADGFQSARTTWLVPPALSVPDLTLRKLAGVREVSGRVIDPDGKPVADVVVFEAGDGPGSTRSITDAEGRFRVAGILDAPALLFARKAGHHLLGRRIEPGERSFELTLRPLDQPPAAPLKPDSAAVDRDEERSIARALVEKVRQTPGFATSNFLATRQVSTIRAMLDPERTIVMIEDQVVRPDPEVLAALAIGFFEVDPTRAQRTLDSIDPPVVTATAMLSVFDRVGTAADPAFRRGLLERAARRGRAMDEPGQAASVLARVADRLLDMGMADEGSRVAREAHGLFEQAQPRTVLDPNIALALARVDVPAALNLIDGRGQRDDQIQTLRAGIAARIVALDPAEARRLIALLPESQQRAARRAACARLAAKDVEAARVLAAESHDPMVEALVPAIAAKARAARDPDGARALLRESVERIGKLGDGEGLGWRPAPAVALARLLPLAARIDPERAPDLLWLALSRRTPRGHDADLPGFRPDVRRRFLDLAELAVLAGRYDRGAAAVAFAPVAERIGSVLDEDTGLWPEGLACFRAAAAFDGKAAAAAVEALPDDPPPLRPGLIMPVPRAHSKAKARLAVAETLATPPALRRNTSWLPNDSGGPEWLELGDD